MAAKDRFNMWNDSHGLSKVRTAHPKVDEFLEKVVELGRKYGLSIAHEDGQGGFIVEAYSPVNADWIRSAMVNLDGWDIVNLNELKEV